MTFKTRLTTAIATGAVLVNALAPIALANTVTVSGNGAFSDNHVNLTTNTTNAVNQTNDANITNNVSSNSSSGGNSANFNTGGNSTIVTGAANSTVNVTNDANLNKASLTNCGTCNGGATNVTISGNGADSVNGANVTNANTNFLNQTNVANYDNNIKAKSSTGGNDSSYNTGGDTTIVTGPASTTVDVTNKANANFAQIGGSNGTVGGSSVTIKGNGAFSDNGVNLLQESAVVLNQTNVSDIVNDVYAKANSGKNSAQFNTGGNTIVAAGSATNNVSIDNETNFNAAELSCDCVLSDLAAKVAANGAYSLNGINAAADNAVFNDQLNTGELLNNVYSKAKSGYNSVGFSTGSVNGDPIVGTGAANSSTDVNNAGNVNVLDNGNSIVLPGNWVVGTSFDLNGLWAFLHLV